jgi:DNA-binding NarL/FixJ family response regulator
MRLSYKILWFEDNDAWCESAIPPIKNYLEDKGFDLIVERRANSEGLDALLGKPDFDLILVDLILAGEKGDTLITSIREHRIFTEIVFYSQRGPRAVRDVMREKGADGVYCAGREGEEFDDKVIKVIETTIKKVQEVNHLRGLVLAEVSELDQKMESFLVTYFDKLEKNPRDEKKRELKKKMMESLDESMKTLAKLDEIAQIEKLLKKLDAYGKWMAIKRVCKNELRFADFMMTFGLFNDEVIKIRDVLAHVVEEIDGGGNTILKSMIAEDFVFDDTKCISIRKTLRKHFENLHTGHNLI